MQESKRIVVTGLGAITPIGSTAPAFWEGLMQGRSGAAPITSFDASAHTTKFACEVKDFSPSDHLDRKLINRLDRFSQFAMVATREALADAGLQADRFSSDERERIGVVIGNGIGGYHAVEEQIGVYRDQGPRRISPFYIPLIIPNMVSGMVALEFGLKGPSYSVASACATGNNALFEAWVLIQLGYADMVITGAAEGCITPTLVAGFNAAKALSTRNDSPETASRPFDADRDGFVMGEGAGIFIMETLDHARRRGARARAEVLGFGMSTDAHHMTAPEPEGLGAARAMTDMLRRAGLKPEDVDYVNMHGTSTKLGDIAETKAIKRVFGDHAYKLKLSSTKSMTGHMISAAAAAEAVATVLAIENDCIPPTINFTTPDPECDLDYTFNQPCRQPVRVAISNSFGFGGHNTSVAFCKARD